jgi:hypothetical protein
MHFFLNFLYALFASACGYDIVLPPNGTIHSLHSPYFLQKFYEPDVACQWNIKASEGQRLKVHFDAINLVDNTVACMDDYVMINQDRFCRNASSSGYYITDKMDAKIIFRSSDGRTVKSGGFNVSIEAIGRALLFERIMYIEIHLKAAG